MQQLSTRFAGAWTTKVIGLATILALALSVTGSFSVLTASAASANPTLSNSCGLDVALVLDNSNSINSTELGQMHTAFDSFVDTLNPSTPTQFSVTSFGTTATLIAGPGPASFSNDATTIKGRINGVSTGGGSTNWEDGLIKAASSFDPRPGVQNVIVFASDGEPNKYGANLGSGSGFVQAALDAAVAQADAIKGGGTRIVTLGVGITAANVANMKAISSDDAYYDASSFATLGTTLETIATDLCGGHVTVKKVLDRDGDINTTGDQTPGVGWAFDVGGNPQVTDENGNTLAVDITSSNPFAITETPQDNFTLVARSCTGANNNGTPVGNSISGIQMSNQNIVTCTFYNQPTGGKLHVVKEVNGDALPGSFELNVKETLGTSTDAIIDTSFAGAADPGHLVLLDGASNYTVTEPTPGAYSVEYSADCSGLMPANGDKTCTVTNTALPPESASITVVKQVLNTNGGTKSVSDFPLFLDGDSVVSGDSNIVSVAGSYHVTETGDTAYHASFSGACDANGNVAVALGNSYTCVITNDDVPAELTVIKHVINDNNGGSSAANFTMNVSGTNVSSDSFPGSEDGTTLTLDAGAYSVGELPVVGYDMTASADCSGTVAVGEHKTCTITNNDAPPLPQCSDESDNDADGLIDSADPGCHVDANASNSESYVPGDNSEADGGSGSGTQCSDGLDNDGDSLVDAADPGCHADNDASNNSSYHSEWDNETNNNAPSGGGGGGGGGPLYGFGGGGGGGPVVQGQVLGATCGLYMDKHLRKDSPKNDADQVTRLQAFLNKYGFGTFAPTGHFGPRTLAAVNAFQAKYMDDILKPWSIDAPTGLVYLSTLRKINLMECPELSLQLPALVPWSQNPQAQ